LASSTAQEKTGIISGMVTQNGESLAGANVVVVGTTLGTTIDVSGRFVIRNVPAGTYQIRITIIGYRPAISPDIRVRAGQAIELEVRFADEGQVEFIPRPREMAKPPPTSPPTWEEARPFPVDKPPSVNDIPRFPWPPPKTSAQAVIAAEALQARQDLRILADVAKALMAAMDSCGYGEKKYYWIPKGFALVSRIEQIQADGSPKPGKDRWSIEVATPRIFSLPSLLEALFTANAGYYRIVVFAVTPQSFAESDSVVSREDAMKWLHGGMQSLPPSIGNIPFTSEYTCTALIYEFEQVTPNHAPRFMDPSNLTGQMHLEKSQLRKALGL
jgi:hypothetical protein